MRPWLAGDRSLERLNQLAEARGLRTESGHPVRFVAPDPARRSYEVAAFETGRVATRPEALIYEDQNRRMRLLGVEYVVIAEAWHANNQMPPVLMGQLFNYVGSPNRYGIPAFYELHVWAWKNNPNGTFADWNPLVACDDFVGGH